MSSLLKVQPLQIMKILLEFAEKIKINIEKKKLYHHLNVYYDANSTKI